jgi:hypothetical protein
MARLESLVEDESANAGAFEQGKDVVGDDTHADGRLLSATN